jgi:hypothetical protein
MIRPSSDPDHPDRRDRARTDEKLQLREHNFREWISQENQLRIA